MRKFAGYAGHVGVLMLAGGVLDAAWIVFGAILTAVGAELLENTARP